MAAADSRALANLPFLALLSGQFDDPLPAPGGEVSAEDISPFKSCLRYEGKGSFLWPNTSQERLFLGSSDSGNVTGS
jgi:hypothetical protein